MITQALPLLFGCDDHESMTWRNHWCWITFGKTILGKTNLLTGLKRTWYEGLCRCFQNGRNRLDFVIEQKMTWYCMKKFKKCDHMRAVGIVQYYLNLKLLQKIHYFIAVNIEYRHDCNVFKATVTWNWRPRKIIEIFGANNASRQLSHKIGEPDKLLKCLVLTIRREDDWYRYNQSLKKMKHNEYQ